MVSLSPNRLPTVAGDAAEQADYNRVAITPISRYAERMNVSLPPDLQRFVDTQVTSGAYDDAAAVIRDGLQLLAERKMQVSRLESEIATGMDSIRAGRVVSGQSVFDELKARRA